MEKKGTIRTIDLFCGSGGLSLGASQAIAACGRNHDALVAVDVDVNALRVYGRNFRPRCTLSTNVASMVDYKVDDRGANATLSYEPEIVDHRLGAFVDRVDLVLAGPPCQGHSNLNNHTRRADPRNGLYVATAAVAIGLKTKAFVAENVPDILSDRTEVVRTARKIMEDAGYHVSEATLSATELGGGQTRKRHFLVATLVPHRPLELIVGDLKAPPMTLREVIGDLEFAPPRSFMDKTGALSDENKIRIDWLIDNQADVLPNELRPDCHKGGHTYPSVYGRLDWEKPAQTITTGFMTPGRGRFVHPTQRRVITPREAARIQGFTDNYDFRDGDADPSKALLSKWIGDAVPCCLGYAATLGALTAF